MKMSLLKEIASKSCLGTAWEHVKKKKDVTPGIDEETVSAFSENLDNNLAQIASQLLNKKYVFNTVIETDIPKKDHKKLRKIRIFTIRDKIVQRAIQKTFEKKRKPTALFPELNNNISIGFISKVSANENLGVKKAVEVVKKNYSKGYRIMTTADIADFFDNIDKDKLEKFIIQRLHPDTSINWLIEQLFDPIIIKKDRQNNTLSAIQTSTSGVGQGSVISPLLSNIYLMTFDMEVEKKRIPALRYADDFAYFSKNTDDAKKHLEILRKILKKTAGLEFHPNNSKKKPHHFLLSRYGCFLGIKFKKTVANRWEIGPVESKQKEMENKIKKKLDPNTNTPLIDRLNYINNSLSGWINSYKYVKCTKKIVNNTYLKLYTVYEERLNYLLIKKGITTKRLNKTQLEFLGVGNQRINIQRKRK